MRSGGIEVRGSMVHVDEERGGSMKYRGGVQGWYGSMAVFYFNLG